MRKEKRGKFTVIYGDHTYGNIKVTGRYHGRVNIGKYCSISQSVKVFMAGDHIKRAISTYPFTHDELEIAKLITGETPSIYEEHKFEVNIGNDVWLGWGSTIFRDVKIGDGVIVGAFSLITKDIEPYSIVVGHSRTVKKRFSDKEIKFLLKLKWWDFSDEIVSEIAPILMQNDINLLRSWYKKWTISRL